MRTHTVRLVWQPGYNTSMCQINVLQSVFVWNKLVFQASRTSNRWGASSVDHMSQVTRCLWNSRLTITRNLKGIIWQARKHGPICDSSICVRLLQICLIRIGTCRWEMRLYWASFRKSCHVFMNLSQGPTQRLLLLESLAKSQTNATVGSSMSRLTVTKKQSPFKWAFHGFALTYVK